MGIFGWANRFIHKYEINELQGSEQIEQMDLHAAGGGSAERGRRGRDCAGGAAADSGACRGGERRADRSPRPGGNPRRDPRAGGKRRAGGIRSPGRDPRAGGKRRAGGHASARNRGLPAGRTGRSAPGRHFEGAFAGGGRAARVRVHPGANPSGELPAAPPERDRIPAGRGAGPQVPRGALRKRRSGGRIHAGDDRRICGGCGGRPLHLAHGGAGRAHADPHAGAGTSGVPGGLLCGALELRAAHLPPQWHRGGRCGQRLRGDHPGRAHRAALGQRLHPTGRGDVQRALRHHGRHGRPDQPLGALRPDAGLHPAGAGHRGQPGT